MCGMVWVSSRTGLRGEEASPEKAIFQPNLEKKEHVHEVDKETKGRRDQQTTNLVITTIVANLYPEDGAEHATQMIFKNPRMICYLT